MWYFVHIESAKSVELYISAPFGVTITTADTAFRARESCFISPIYMAGRIHISSIVPSRTGFSNH